MKKDKCFYCHEKLEGGGENPHTTTIDFKRISCCSATCLADLEEYFEFVKANKRWCVGGLVIGMVLLTFSIVPFVISATLGVIILAVGWAILGATIYFFPAITTQAHFYFSLKFYKKAAKIAGVIMLTTTPLWFLMLIFAG